MTIRAGLIGYGLAGRVFHAPLLQAAGIQVATVATHRAAEVARDLPEATVLTDPTAVATDSSLDLVVIASPNDTHVPLAMAALQSGRSVVIDKPFTHTVAEAEQLIATARERRCLLSVFHNRRWDSDFQTLRASMARGDLGEVVSYQCRFDRYRLEVTDRWREKPTPGVGLFFDLGPHLVDQALTLFGWPDWLMADLNMQRPGTQVDDGFHLLMGKGRLRILLAATVLAAAPEPKYVVHGTHGSFIKAGIDVQEDQLKAGMRPGDAGFGVEPASHAAHLTVMQDGKAKATILPTLPGDYKAYYVGIRNAMETGSPVPVSAEDACDSMRILESACRSHREGVRIALSR
ncbi:MAG TPA: oxidoreductase [Acidobacteriaceae bacterium]|jgi:predicted dehydrogenase|nr:oxidoreductase [Acidobacteriaceae bacterium]